MTLKVIRVMQPPLRLRHVAHRPYGTLVGAEFNAPLDTVQVISEAVFTANHLTDTDKQNSTGK